MSTAGGRADEPIPGPRGHPLFGVLRELRRDSLGTFGRLAGAYGEVVRLPAGPRKVFLVNHPDHIRRILQDNHHNYRLTPFYRKLRPVFGAGLLTSEGERWSRQRRMLQPAFQRRRLDALDVVVTETASIFFARWQRQAARGVPLDIAEETAGLTLAIAARGLFGAELGEQSAALARDIRDLMEGTVARTMALTPLGDVLPTRRNRRLAAARRAVDRLSRRVIEDRPGSDALLACLSGARGDAPGGPDQRDLLDQVKTMLVSATVTTANALTWAWYLLARNPAAANRLEAEARTVLGTRLPGAADLDRLVYTRMAVHETLRLFPPTWRMARTAVGADAFGRYRVPAGATVVFSPYLVHRHPAFWDDPEAFDPERFTPERATTRPRFAYVPFGGGPRACIGSQLATLELVLIVAMAARRVRLRPVCADPVEIESVVTLRPRHGLPVTLETV